MRTEKDITHIALQVDVGNPRDNLSFAGEILHIAIRVLNRRPVFAFLFGCDCMAYWQHVALQGAILRMWAA